MKRYATLFILLLMTEVAIALFRLHDFIRGFLGDVLVIPLMYTFLKMVTKMNSKTTLFVSLGVAFAIEFIQLANLFEEWNFKIPLVKIVLGSTYDGWDLVAYLFGILPVLFIEKFRNHGTL